MTKKTEQKIDLVLIGIFTLAMGIFGTYLYHQDSDTNFLLEGQYNPKYIMFSHFEMSKECDKYNLVYNFEDGVCNHDHIEKLHEMEELDDR